MCMFYVVVKLHFYQYLKNDFCWYDTSINLF